MATAKRNEFSYSQAFGVLLLLVFFLILIAPRSEITHQMQVEADSIADFYGEGTYNNVYRVANVWYTNIVVKTHIREKALKGMSLKDTIGEDETISGKLSFLEDWVENADAYAQSRIELLFDMLWWFLMRLSMILHWLPLWLPVFCDACYTGLCQKRIKLFTFGYANPSLLRIFARAISIALFCGFVAFAIPWAIPPIAIPLIFGVIVCAAGFMITNFQWRF